ncbi:Histone-lysine N-methyltransferase ASHR1 [Escovopsis weberi]|uniref:Histone-lysine N-methyltransferase ASHR1 n=1 Tax=Escovopsis weberi TaxID=150374 RepID=A0A0M9VV51_ESCWE|nr:Histone-lysine N-methyltransferase ASHR1 [Escovopsis weberi]
MDASTFSLPLRNRGEISPSSSSAPSSSSPSAPAKPAPPVRPHPRKGRALHAASRFQPGDVILALEPLLLLPSRFLLSSLCSHCFRPGEPRACSRCRAAYYCDPACQAAAWKAVHSAECRALRAGLPDETRRRALPTPVRALIQALVKPRVQDGLRDLVGHVHLRREGAEWENLQLMATGASAYSGKGTGPEAVQRACELLSKIEMNAFQRPSNDMGLTGIFLESTLAMVNHSCVPNALVQFSGRKAFLRAGQLINAGDEIEIAYTDPLFERKQALSSYKFECRCPRCTHDLSVYQVAATYPDLRLNSSLSLLPDVAAFREHPAVTDTTKQSMARRFTRTTGILPSSLKADTGPLLQGALQEQYRAYPSLLMEDLWAVSPLPDTIAAISVYYFNEGKSPLALATACFSATACDPFRYPQPFHPMRLHGLLAVAKLLSVTAPDTAALQESLASVAARASLDRQVRDVLNDIDQVSLCQMLLLMILAWTPPSYQAQWEVSAEALEMLKDINQLQGRERELSLIDEWRRKPDGEQSKAFFDFAVVQKMDALARIGRAALKADFGTR